MKAVSPPSFSCTALRKSNRTPGRFSSLSSLSIVRDFLHLSTANSPHHVKVRPPLLTDGTSTNPPFLPFNDPPLAKASGRAFCFRPVVNLMAFLSLVPPPLRVHADHIQWFSSPVRERLPPPSSFLALSENEPKAGLAPWLEKEPEPLPYIFFSPCGPEEDG